MPWSSPHHHEVLHKYALQGRIQNFLIFFFFFGGGGGKLWFRRDCWTFLWQIIPHRDNHVFFNLWKVSAVGAGNTALRADATNVTFFGKIYTNDFLLLLENIVRIANG